MKHIRVCRTYCNLMLLLILILFCQPVVAGTQQKTILVLWHELGWDDIKSMEPSQFNGFAVGLLNVRVAGGNIIHGAYLSIASGARAFGLADGAKMYYSSDTILGNKVGQIYQLRTGREPKEDQIVNLDIAPILQLAAQANYPLEIGMLGTKLTDNRVATAVYGNSDLKDQIFRWAALIGMDSWGLVPNGFIGKDVLLEDPDYPFGQHTDYAQLLQAIISSDPDLAIVDLGDPYRYSMYQALILPQRQPAIEKRMVEEGWGFLSQLHSELPDRHLIIISPYPGDLQAQNGQWVTPIIMIGGESGLLSSPTTKWPGIVTNMDVAPTILKNFGIDKGLMLGHAMEIELTTSEAAIQETMSLEKKVFRISKYRKSLLSYLVSVQIFLYLFTLALLIVPKTLNPRFIRLVQSILILSLSTPLLLLVISKAWVIALLIVVGLGYGFYQHKDPLVLAMIVGLATATLIIFDVVTGYSLMRFSYLGYDPLAGARFYGLGNEYMGVLIGALIIGWSLFHGLVQKKYIGINLATILDLAVFTFTTIIIAAPQWGTNVGGTIAAIAGFGSTWLSFHKKKFSLNKVTSVILLGLVIMLSIGFLMYIDMNRPKASQSHIGQTVSIIRQQGLGAVIQIIKRKLEMNFKLFRYSQWSKALVVAIATMGASLIWPSKYLQWLIKNHPFLVKGIFGTLVATVVALAVNDSGVVAAATCCSFAATTMLCTALGLKHNLLSS